MDLLCNNCDFNRKFKCNVENLDSSIVNLYSQNDDGHVCLVKEIFTNKFVNAKNEEALKMNILDYKPDDCDKDAYNLLYKISKNIGKCVSNGNNFFIYSKNTGNGKTSWARELLANYLISSLNPDKDGLFLNFSTYMANQKRNIQRPSDEFNELVDKVYDVDLLVLDDIGSYKMSDYDTNELYLITNLREDKKKSTIYTSNLDAVKLREVLNDDRVYSRIVNSSYNIELKGTDKRSI